MIDDCTLILILLFVSLHANDSVIRLCTCGRGSVDAAIRVPFVANPELLSFMALYVNKNYKDYREEIQSYQSFPGAWSRSV